MSCRGLAHVVTDDTRRRISLKQLGVPKLSSRRKHTPEHTAKIAAGNRGKKLSAEHKLAISIRMSGSNHPKWKGGITPLHKAVRSKLGGWKRAVKERDGYRCVWCGSTENLHADHIKPLALYPELGRELSNGRTLCFECHKTTPTYGGRTAYLKAVS